MIIVVNYLDGPVKCKMQPCVQEMEGNLSYRQNNGLHTVCFLFLQHTPEVSPVKGTLKPVSRSPVCNCEVTEVNK